MTPRSYIETPSRVRVYCASPAHRAGMWREDLIPAIYTSRIVVVSSWHEIEDFATADANADSCARYWEQDFKEIRQADALLAFAERSDHPNGTLVEIGYAIAQEIPVHIVGSFAFGTWRHHPSVTHHATLRVAVAAITGEAPTGTSEGETS